MGNIMMFFECSDELTDFLDKELLKPAEYKLDEAGRLVFRSRSGFGPCDSSGKANGKPEVEHTEDCVPEILPYLGDFSSAFRLYENCEYGFLPIQQDEYRAPEVILGFPWTTSADIWNIGVLVC